MAKDESNRKDEALLVQLVLMFQAAAMQQMGKVQNPITDKVERNLEQARFSIDMLEMIQNRTRDSLAENEKKFLEHTLFELRMNYVDEVKKGQKEKMETESAPQDGEKRQPDSGQPGQDSEEQKEPGKDRPDSGEASSE